MTEENASSRMASIRSEWQTIKLLADAPHSLEYYDQFETENYLVMMSERCPESLTSLIYEYTIPIEHKLKLTAQLIEAVAAMHQRGILHLDLKPDNVLIGPEGGVRVTDFGTSLRTDSAVASLRGTFPFLAPEMFTHESFPEQLPFSEAVDIFALGCTIAELWLRGLPHENSAAETCEHW
jgi:eukaryotic-like serine/threonine-protein kinase